jgi:hypothetical protein
MVMVINPTTSGATSLQQYQALVSKATTNTPAKAINGGTLANLVAAPNAGGAAGTTGAAKGTGASTTGTAKGTGASTTAAKGKGKGKGKKSKKTKRALRV